MAKREQVAGKKVIGKQEKQWYQLKITLVGSKPPIWRRLLVPSHYHLGYLHMIIQIAMGWTNSHLHQFEINGQRYCNPEFDEEASGEDKDERKYELASIVGEGDKFSYEYDFGDGWQHDVLVEKVLPCPNGVSAPVCLDGKNACPPEDCGGIGGYYDLLEITKNPKYPDYKEMNAWLGDINPAEFDIEAVNSSLKDFSKDPDAEWGIGVEN